MISKIKRFFDRRKMKATHYIFIHNADGFRAGHVLLTQNELGKRGFKICVDTRRFKVIHIKKTIRVRAKHWVHTGIVPTDAKNILQEKLLQ